MDDLISRAAVCECLGKMIHEYREKGENDLADGMILARRYGIKCLPAVDAIPVNWISAYMNQAYGRIRSEIIREMLDAWMEQEAR